MKVEKKIVQPAYKKEEGFWVLRTQEFLSEIPFLVAEQSLITIPPGKIGGNHKHPRKEAFIGLGEELYVVWQDSSGDVHEEKMEDGSVNLFFIPAMLPHAVINRSKTAFATLYEYASETQHDVESVELV
jgi:uncharacterized RmlC-like cupin family protein